MADLTLYYGVGACSLAPHIALEEAGADYDVVRMDLANGQQRSADYLAINPKGRVPALKTEKGVLTENPVILGYIAQTYPAARLAPTDDKFAFGLMQSFYMFLASTLHPGFAHIFRPARYVDGEDHQAAVKAKGPANLVDYFGLVEKQLEDGRPYVTGQDYSIADPYLLVFSRWLDRGDYVDAATIPHVMAHRARIEERPAVQRVLMDEAS